MYKWQDFMTVFKDKPDYTPDHKQVESITRHRKELGGTLFYDKIWSTLGLKQANKNYPPKSNQELKSVWQKIAQCTALEHQRQALLYYVLKDFHNYADSDLGFAEGIDLPTKYRLLITGLHELDHCHFKQALERLTDPSLQTTFADEILHVLLSHPKCDKGLAIAYYITVSPPLQNDNTRDAYFARLCETNVVEAYQFLRTQPESRRENLFIKLVLSIHSEPAGESRSRRCQLLLSLPLNEEEVSWLEKCLMKGEGSKYAGAKDSVLVRRIAMSSVIKDVEAFSQVRGQKISGVNWEDILPSIEEAVAT